MKLKSRIKRALFAFFKDEILQSVGYDKPIQNQIIQHICKEMKMTEIRSEILLDGMERYGMPVNVVYEKSLEEARKRIFEESMKFIQIDEKSVIDPHIYPHRSIKLSLFVGERYLN
jgi:hypothetical protein